MKQLSVSVVMRENQGLQGMSGARQNLGTINNLGKIDKFIKIDNLVANEEDGELLILE